MPFELKYGGKLLLAGEGHAELELTNGLKLILGKGTARTWRPASMRPVFHQGEIVFTTTAGQLPPEDHEYFRQKLNEHQKWVHDTAPEFRYPRRGGLLPNPREFRRGQPRPKVHRPKPIPLEKPPASIEVGDNYALIIARHGEHDHLPYLEVGKRCVVETWPGQDPIANVQFSRSIGTIKSFMLV